MNLAERLRSDILAGRLAPGTLLSQTDIARTHGVSRIPVRDAFQQLAAERLVDIVVGRGARVISLSAAELAEIFDLRVMLECDLLRRAIARAGSEAVREAEYALRRSSLEAGRPGWQDGDHRFHAALYAPADRQRQMRLVDELRSACVLHASRYESLMADTPRWLADHDAIFEAYAAGRADDATARLEAHIRQAGERLAILRASAPGV